MKIRPEQVQFVAAMGILVVGLLVYLLDRPPSHIYFIPDGFTLPKVDGQVFGVLGQSLPTFAHTFVFILFTAVVIMPSSLQMIFICVAWFTIEVFFEVAQIVPIAHWIAGHVPGDLSGIPFLENTAAYFSHGTFDGWDLVSIGLGTVAAYLVYTFSQHGKPAHVVES